MLRNKPFLFHIFHAHNINVIDVILKFNVNLNFQKRWIHKVHKRMIHVVRQTFVTNDSFRLNRETFNAVSVPESSKHYLVR